jgi:hypothetical protein
LARHFGKKVLLTRDLFDVLVLISNEIQTVTKLVTDGTASLDDILLHSTSIKNNVKGCEGFSSENHKELAEFETFLGTHDLGKAEYNNLLVMVCSKTSRWLIAELTLNADASGDKFPHAEVIQFVTDRFAKVMRHSVWSSTPQSDRTSLQDAQNVLDLLTGHHELAALFAARKLATAVDYESLLKANTALLALQNVVEAQFVQNLGWVIHIGFECSLDKGKELAVGLYHRFRAASGAVMGLKVLHSAEATKDLVDQGARLKALLRGMDTDEVNFMHTFDQPKVLKKLTDFEKLVKKAGRELAQFGQDSLSEDASLTMAQEIIGNVKAEANRFALLSLSSHEDFEKNGLRRS